MFQNIKPGQGERCHNRLPDRAKHINGADESTFTVHLLPIMYCARDTQIWRLEARFRCKGVDPNCLTEGRRIHQTTILPQVILTPLQSKL